MTPSEKIAELREINSNRGFRRLYPTEVAALLDVAEAAIAECMAHRRNDVANAHIDETDEALARLGGGR